MKFFKRILVLCLALALVVGMAACSCDKTPDENTPDVVDEPVLDPEALAFKLDTQEATVGEVASSYESYVSMMSQYGMPAPATDEEIDQALQTILDDLLSKHSIIWKAKEMGITETSPEVLAAFETSMAAERQGFIDQYATMAMEEAGDASTGNPADYAAQALATINTEIDGFSPGMDLDAYMVEYYSEFLKTEALATASKAQVVADVTITDADVQGWYDARLAEQQSMLSEAPIDYRTRLQQYEAGVDTVPVLYVPEGFVRISMIALSPEGEIDPAYLDGKTVMDGLEKEYGKLLLEGNKDSARKGEIETEYAKLKEETDALFLPFAEGPKTSAAAAYAEILESGDFDAAMAKYNAGGSTASQLLYLTDADSTVPETIWTAVGKMEAGQVSEIIEADGAYYIVKLLEVIPGTPVALSSIMDLARTAALAEKQDLAWQQRQSDWLAEAKDAAEFFKDNYAMVGKV